MHDGAVEVEEKRAVGLSSVAWTPARDLDYRDWLLEGRRIGVMARASVWWIGDWLLYGTSKWGERYVEAAKITGYDPKTLRNIRYVSACFELSLRRDNLTWSHHALLAALESDEQAEWLDRAIADRLSVDDLRIELRTSKRGRYSLPSAADSHGEGKGHADVICPKCGERVIVDSDAPPVNSV
jgi:hypothetical protein